MDFGCGFLAEWFPGLDPLPLPIIHKQPARAQASLDYHVPTAAAGSWAESKQQEKMKNEGKSHLCPLCGSKRKPQTKRFRPDVRYGRPVVLKPPTAGPDSVVAESSDDKTANDFAALLLTTRNKRL